MSTNRYDIALNKNKNIRTNSSISVRLNTAATGTVRLTPTTAVSCFLLLMESASFLLKINCILSAPMIL